MTEHSKDKNNRKSKIAKLGITFFIIMIILTFLSKTIINMTLPKVTIASPDYGEIDREIIGRGKIVPRKSIEYFSPSPMIIEDIKVSQGEMVEKGQVLFIFDKKGIQNQILEKEYSLSINENLLKKLFIEKEILEDEDYIFLENRIKKLEQQSLSTKTEDEILSTLMRKNKELEEMEIERGRKIERINIDITNKKLDIEKIEGEILRLETKLQNLGLKKEEKDRLEEQVISSGYSLKNNQGSLKKLLIDKEAILSEEFIALKDTIMELEKQLIEIDNKDETLLEIVEKKEELERLVVNKDKNLEKIKVDIENQNLVISKIKVELNKLHSSLNTMEIKAEADGIIRELNYTIGKTTNDIRPLYILDIIDEGYQVSAEFPIGQKHIIEEGQKAIIEIIDSHKDEIKGTIDSVISNSDMEVLELLINIEGNDYNMGDTASIAILWEGGEYDIIIPNSAIHKEGEDNYSVYIMEEKNGPLGTEYYTIKRDIEILASNNKVSGISSVINSRDKIIIRSNKTLRDGMRVVVDD